MNFKTTIYTLFIAALAVLILLNCNTQEKTPTRETNSPYSDSLYRTASVLDTANMIFPDAEKNSCRSCHGDIEHIRDPHTGMMQEIYHLAAKVGIPDNECIVCHGGSTNTSSKTAAHSGSPQALQDIGGAINFYPDPASVWINEKTCGLCHSEQVETQFTSLMFTEAGKIQGTTWGFGGIQGYLHNVANIATEEVEAHKRLGSSTYKAYMKKLKESEPQVFPGKMKGLPESPSPEELAKDPSLSVYTYLRAECQRCHTGVKGSQSDGDYRGTGCGSCHIPYSTKGLYEGADPAIDPKQAGRPLVHSIQSTRDAKVKVHGHEYSGIPTKTCTACHNRGRRIGVSYEGLMETSYSSPLMSDASDQKKLHKKNYIHLQADVHLTKGMVCQDCHTSGDMHSLGDLTGAIQAAVEIECQDCHGTPFQYPWELPIGYGDEIVGTSPKKGEPRGLSQEVMKHLYKGWVAPVNDGYLISSRGNAMPHLVKNGTDVILYSASGKDIKLSPLKKLTDEDRLSKAGKVAMTQIATHIDNMECYTCHATWAPQCYGCHINIDYSEPKLKKDWVEIAKHPALDGTTSDRNLKLDDKTAAQVKKYILSGEVKESRSFLRWEDPPLVMNGEHRVSPAIPGCQTTVTVTDKNGDVQLLNHIFRIPHVEGSTTPGQLAIDIAPLQPHTVQAGSRSCESCHNNPKSMGYGIEGGTLYQDPSKNTVMDLQDINGKTLPQQADTQFNAIPNLTMDWSRFLDDSFRQLQTVGHHLTGSRALNANELSKLDRRGVCMSCHQTVPDKDLATDLLSHVAEYGDVKIDNKAHTNILNRSIKISAWVEMLFYILLLLVVGYFVYSYYLRKKHKA